MRVPRETVYSALFTLLSAIPQFVTASRKLRLMDDMAAADCPALFMTQEGETFEAVTHLPYKRTLRVKLWVYVKYDQGTEAVPATELNVLLDAIDTALSTPANERQTLGGLVYHCRIEGEIETDEGFFQNAAGALVPVVILVP